MQKISRNKQLYNSNHAKINYKKNLGRKRHKQKLRRGWIKYLKDIRENAKQKNSTIVKPSKYRRVRKKPQFGDIINFIYNTKNAFTNEKISLHENVTFEIPKIFSLTDNYSASFLFLKNLFYVLYNQSKTDILLDYINCERIDVDASVCMDIILTEFINYYKACNNSGHFINVKSIVPINYEKDNIHKILFSIGSFASIIKKTKKFPDIIPYKLCIGDINNSKASAIREVHITEMVEYVLKSMAKMKRTLTAEAENNLFKVIGEVLINAEEHSTGNKRYSIGYFQDSEQNGIHEGIFNLVILNFGKTIYEKFKDIECPNKDVVEQMKELSKVYTRKNLFSKADFEEETLWTLYALQEGVTSKKDWKRGNGSIRFIDSFFTLKGDSQNDTISYLSIVSGNTRITFDGVYRLIDKVKGVHERKFKMMTFNESGDIQSKPDKKYVTFAKNYFPGTIISAKISIKESITEEKNNG